MRYFGLLIFFLSIPVLIGAMRSRSPIARRLFYSALGASPFVFGWLHLNVALVSWSGWPGYVKGITVALPDLLAIVILWNTKRRSDRFGLPILFGVYLFCCALSILQAEVPMASIFYCWQLLRILLVLLAVARVCAIPGAPEWIVYGVCVGAVVQCLFSMKARLLDGVIQAHGTMGHQNLLGMMMHFALLAPLAMIIAGDRRHILKIGALAALITVALTGSRGTVAFALGGATLLIAASTLQRPTGRRLKIVGLSALTALLAAPLVYGTFADRYSISKYESVDGERAAFERAAQAMWTDHPLGVGANEYVTTANSYGYSERAGVSWMPGSRGANVHNVYLLIAAETGWLGLVSFTVLIGGAVVAGIQTSRLHRRFPYNPLALGYAVSLIVIALHGFYEWIFVLEPVQYLFAIAIGSIVGLRSQQDWLRRRARWLKSQETPAQPEPQIGGHAPPRRGAVSA